LQWLSDTAQLIKLAYYAQRVRGVHSCMIWAAASARDSMPDEPGMMAATNVALSKAAPANIGPGYWNN
jgi:hypothetical protein